MSHRKAKKQVAKKDGLSIAQQEMYSGPIPDPESMKKYEEIKPGFADRLLKMAEKEQEHRISVNKKLLELEQKDQDKDYKYLFRGQVLAILAVLLICSLSLYAFYKGYPKQGAIIACTIIITLVGSFLISRKKNK